MIGEKYKLQCVECSRTIEISTQPPHRCPHCGACLLVDWDAEHRAWAPRQPKEPQKPGSAGGCVDDQ